MWSCRGLARLDNMMYSRTGKPNMMVHTYSRTGKRWRYKKTHWWWLHRKRKWNTTNHLANLFTQDGRRISGDDQYHSLASPEKVVVIVLVMLGEGWWIAMMSGTHMNTLSTWWQGARNTYHQCVGPLGHSVRWWWCDTHSYSNPINPSTRRSITYATRVGYNHIASHIISISHTHIASLTLIIHLAPPPLATRACPDGIYVGSFRISTNT